MYINLEDSVFNNDSSIPPINIKFLIFLSTVEHRKKNQDFIRKSPLSLQYLPSCYLASNTETNAQVMHHTVSGVNLVWTKSSWFWTFNVKYY